VAQGDIMYRGATDWIRLAKGTAGQVLVMNDAEDAPEWAEPVTGVTIPIGTVLDYAGTTLPDQFLEADGSAVSRTGLPELFDVIGTTFGVGDGTTSFELP